MASSSANNDPNQGSNNRSRHHQMSRNPKPKSKEKRSFITKHNPNATKPFIKKETVIDGQQFQFGGGGNMNNSAQKPVRDKQIESKQNEDDKRKPKRKRKIDRSKMTIPHSMLNDEPKPRPRPKLIPDQNTWKCQKCGCKRNKVGDEYCKKCNHLNPIVVFDEFDPFKEEVLIEVPAPELGGSSKHTYNKKRECSICRKFLDNIYDHVQRLTHKLKDRELLYKCSLCGVVDVYWDPKSPGVFHHLLTESEMIINLYKAYIKEQPSNSKHVRLKAHVEFIETILREYFNIGVKLHQFSTSVYGLDEYDKQSAIHLMGSNPEITDYKQEVLSNCIFMYGITNCHQDTSNFIKMMDDKTKLFDSYAAKVQMPDLRQLIAKFANTIKCKISERLKLATFLIILDPYQIREDSHFVGPEHIDHVLFGNVTICITFNGQYMFNFPHQHTFKTITVNGGYILDAIRSALFSHSFRTLSYTPQHCGRLLLSFYDYPGYNLLHSMLTNNYLMGKNIIRYAWKGMSNNNNDDASIDSKDEEYKIITEDEMDELSILEIDEKIEKKEIAIINTVDTYAAYLQLRTELSTDNGVGMKINTLITMKQLDDVLIACDGLNKNGSEWTWINCVKFDKLIAERMSEDAWRRIQEKSNKMRISEWPIDKLNNVFPNEDEQKDRVLVNESHQYDADNIPFSIKQERKEEEEDDKDKQEDEDEDESDEVMVMSSGGDNDKDEQEYEDDDKDKDFSIIAAAKKKLKEVGLSYCQDILPNYIMNDPARWHTLNKNDLEKIGFSDEVAIKFMEAFNYDYQDQL